ncbi:hypothetical protein KJ848_01645 [Patescibacteria group bacterium]|nr:hypothetical protein [Patescibacteria group bacterium]MBU2158865.1 hypothetical protein [Patescibacteria group bacterium]
MQNLKNITIAFVLVVVATFSVGVSIANAVLLEVSPCGGYVGFGSDSCVDDPGVYEPPTPSPTVSMTATPLTIESGRSSQLSFTSSRVTSCSIDNGVGSVSANANGTRTVSPTSNTTYTITCQSTSGPVTAERTITVAAAPEPFTAYCSAGPEVAQVNESIEWSATTSAGGGSNQLTWKRGNPSYTKICSGGQNYASLNNDCSDDIMDGSTCTVEGARCRQSAGCDGQEFSDGEGQNNAHAAYGSVLKYTCTASGSSNATYTYAWSGTNGLTGTTKNVSKAYSSTGTKSAQVAVSASTSGTAGYGWQAIGTESGPICTDNVNSVTGGVDHRRQPTCSATTVGTRYTQYDIKTGSENTCPSQYANDRYQVTGQEYVCEATSGSTTGTAVAICSAEVVGKTPTATLTANPASIVSGLASLLTWSSTNASMCSLNESIGTISTSGTRSVSPQTTTTYTLLCSASGGTSSAGTWQYYDSDTSDFACPVTDTNKAYSSVPNCPANPQGKACTNAPGLTICKKNTVNACNINTEIYQCQGSASSPDQVATASATVTVSPVATLADLTAGSISPTTARVGQSTTLSGTVTNSGGAVASASNTYFAVTNSSGKAIHTSTVNIPAIQPGAGDTRSFAITFPAEGTYQAQVCGDWFGSVAEANEGNNCGPLTLISVTSIVNANTVSCSVSNTSVNPGGSVTYSATPSGSAGGPYTWVAADGATGFGTASSANRTFTTAGNYGMQVSASGANSAAVCPIVSVAACTGTRTVDISASPARVRSGSSTTLSWNAAGINTTCVITGPGVSQTVSAASCTVPTGSSSSGTITAQSTYRISCDNGAITDSVIVNVIPEFEEF